MNPYGFMLSITLRLRSLKAFCYAAVAVSVQEMQLHVTEVSGLLLRSSNRHTNTSFRVSWLEPCVSSVGRSQVEVREALCNAATQVTTGQTNVYIASDRPTERPLL